MLGIKKEVNNDAYFTSTISTFLQQTHSRSSPLLIKPPIMDSQIEVILNFLPPHIRQI